jgi:hypothetical protein
MPTPPNAPTPAAALAPERDRPLRSLLRRPLWCGALIAFIGGAIGFRAWILFRSAIPPGVDAGYYPLQSRTILEHGRLAYDDVPVRFAIDAIVAKVAMVIAGWSVDDATLWASRIVDSVVQPFVALAIFLIAFVWSRGKTIGLAGAIGTSLIAVASRPIIDMVGDFEKQSMAFTWSAFAWAAVWRALAADRGGVALRRWAFAVVMLLLAGGTHVGTFGGAALGCIAMVVTWALVGGASRRTSVAVAAMVLASCGIALVGMWAFAPAKTASLLRAPFLLFEQGDDGLRGMSWRVGIVYAAGLIVLGVIGATALHRTGCRRQDDDDPPGAEAARRDARADGSLVVAMLVTFAALTCPFFPGDYAMRIGLIAFTPAVIVLLFFLVASSRARHDSPHPAWRRHVGLAAAYLTCAIAAGGALASAGGSRVLQQPPMITEGGLAELRVWRDELGTSLRDVVVARHGLEWWAGFAMHSAVRLRELREGDADRYERLFVLRERRGAGGGPDGGGNRPGEPGGRRGGPNGGLRGGPGGMQLGPLPPEARVLRQGEWFTLFEVPKDARSSASPRTSPASGE